MRFFEKNLRKFLRCFRKRGRAKPRIMLLDDIKAYVTYEKIKRRAMDIECWRNSMLEPASKQNINDDDVLLETSTTSL